MTAWEVGRYPNFGEFQKFHHVVSTWLAATSVCDALITAILVCCARKKKTGFKRNRSLTMQTGMLTMIVAILDLVFYLTSVSGHQHLLFQLPLSKLYVSFSGAISLRIRDDVNASNARRSGTDGSGSTTTETEGQINTTSNVAGTNYRRDATSKGGDDIVNLNRLPRSEVFVHSIDLSSSEKRHSLRAISSVRFNDFECWASIRIEGPLIGYHGVWA
ncbi:hypothetical protein BKA70DRAFT_1287039 [Coprinopsis sp. MPI-PUGE-AT-0042]|nr:hypothetical protein BKA70DRAFT_1287039 [Coprinopsis sp. MPI-PUGE-AT-0042]